MLVVGNGRLITRDSANTYIENGAVLINGNVIETTGTTEEIRRMYPAAEYIDAAGGVIMPAFINTHEHIYSAFARGLNVNRYNPEGFLDILAKFNPYNVRLLSNIFVSGEFKYFGSPSPITRPPNPTTRLLASIIGKIALFQNLSWGPRFSS